MYVGRREEIPGALQGNFVFSFARVEYRVIGEWLMLCLYLEGLQRQVMDQQASEPHISRGLVPEGDFEK